MIKTTKKFNVTRRLIAFVIAIAVAFNFFVSAANNVKAYDEGDVAASFTYSDGVTRNINFVYMEDEGYYALCMNDFMVASSYSVDVGFDKYGTVWFFDDDYYLFFEYIDPFKNCIVYTSSSIADGVKSLVYDNSGFVIGYKDGQGIVHEILSLEQQNEISKQDGNIQATDYGTHSSVTTEDITSTTAQDVTTESNVTTETPVSTEATTEDPVTTEVKANPVIEKKGSKFTYYKQYNTDYVYISRYSLSKNVLKIDGKTYKNVKTAGFIKKSGKIVYITKKGQAYTVDEDNKNKKVTLLKKNAKSLVKDSKGFVTKIKKKSGTLSVSNK